VRRVDRATGQVTTVIGTGSAGGPTLNARASAQQIDTPTGVALDGAGNLYVALRSNNRIVKVEASSGNVVAVAGTGSSGYTGDGGKATSARLRAPSAVALWGDNVYFTDESNNRIRKVDKDGIITTVAGIGPTNADGAFAGDNGAATQARLNRPAGVAVNGSGEIFIADTNNHRIRKVDTKGIITTLAGICLANIDNPTTSTGDVLPCTVGNPATIGGVPSVTGSAVLWNDGALATTATLNSPAGIALDGSGNIYVADSNNQRIRKFAPGGTISSIAGGGSTGNCLPVTASGSRIDPKNLNQSVGTFTSHSGSCSGGFAGDGRQAAAGRLNAPRGVAIDSAGNVYVADRGNQRVRFIDPGTQFLFTIAGQSVFRGDGGPANDAILGVSPAGVWVDGSGNVFVADTGNGRIRKINASDGIITTVAGGGSNSADENIAATSASLSSPGCIVGDGSGGLIFADRGNNRVRRVDGGGNITTVAGAGATIWQGQLALNAPRCVARASNGDLYVANTGNHTIVKVTAGGLISTIAGTRGLSGASGDGGKAVEALLNSPWGVAVHSDGRLFFVDRGNAVVRVINTDGKILHAAGRYNENDVDGNNANPTDMRLNNPDHVAIDSDGVIYISDQANRRVVTLDSRGVRSDIGASGSTRGTLTVDGPAATQLTPANSAMAVDSSKKVYTSDRFGRILEATPAAATPAP
ncbi:MAG: hypothetical protein ACRD8O_14870, partial [Bryobacteraceae bacterium]